MVADTVTVMAGATAIRHMAGVAVAKWAGADMAARPASGNKAAAKSSRFR